MKIENCMCNNVCSVTKDTNLKEVIRLMDLNHIGAIPVCDPDNCLCGIVTDRDILLRAINCKKDIDETKVAEIMTKDVCNCKENEEIEKAEDLMSKHQIRRIPVCNEDNKLVGIITLGDLANNVEEIGKTNVCDTLENICNCNKKENNS